MPWSLSHPWGRHAVCAAWVLLLAVPLAEAAGTRIEEARFVKLGGIDQWITLRGDNRKNPVLLILHGGPAESQSPLVERYAPFERDFVVLQWDQRGSGATFVNAGGKDQPTSLEQLTQDTIELAGYAKRYLGAKELVLYGHSWGAFLGVNVIRAKPQAFTAFVGVGQTVNFKRAAQWQYRYILARAEAQPNPEAVAALKKSGPPEPGNYPQYAAMRRWMFPYFAPADVQWIKDSEGYLRANPKATPELMKLYGKGYENSMAGVGDELMNSDLAARGYEYQVPFFIIQGKDDPITPTDLVVEYFEHVKAPAKGITLIDGAGHFVAVTHTAQFLEALKQDLKLARR